MNKLEAMQNMNPVLISADELVDINDVQVNKSLSKAERIAEFVVKTRFSDNGLSMEDCLQSILL